MLLEPKNFEQMRRQLEAIPEEKRKVIILVGRHLNEGTYPIAKMLHSRWEELGAVTIRIPKKWTPHFMWHFAAKKGMDEQKMKKYFDSIPDDDFIIDWLAAKGFHVPVLNFHANPYLVKFKFQYDGMRYFVHRKTQLFPNRSFTKDPKMVPHKNEVTAEFGVQGRPKMIMRLRALKPHMIAAKDAFTNGQFGHDYLAEPIVGRPQIEVFASKHAQRFENMIRHLASTGLKYMKDAKQDTGN